ncbi:helicase-associated domain-containing protein [Paenibacillus sp. GXUN7292]|uniref:helicase-associated domain-containing protein n=1 Tax=Paenibacillus sp. GXUN7292 TaxID=3422499 RepID=UPI003D7C8E76
MLLSDMLAKLCAARVEEIGSYHIWRKALRKNEQWHKAVIQAEAAKRAAFYLEAEARMVLPAYMNVCGVQPIEEQQLMERLMQETKQSGVKCMIGLKQLEGAGILFALQRVWGERHYLMPTDIFLSWHIIFFPCAARPLDADQELALWGAGEVLAGARPLDRQMLSMLAELGRSGLKFTSKGLLPLPVAKRLAAAVDMKDNALQAIGLAASGSQPSNAVAFLLAAALSLGLLARSEQALSWNMAKLHSWLAMPPNERISQLQTLVLDQAISNTKNTNAGEAAAYTQLDCGHWYNSSEVIAYHQLLHQCGWLDSIYDVKSKQTYIRKRLLGQYSGSEVIVQANGEILVPADYFLLRWELELVAEYVHDDHMAIYRLTKESLSRAAQYGRKRSDIIQLLQHHAGTLPASIAAMLAEWMSEENAEERTYSAGQQYPQFQAQLAGELTYEVNFVESDIAQFLFAAQLDLRQYTWSEESVARMELKNGLLNLPPMWTGKYQAYHSSTKKELIEQAILWKTEVLIQYSGKPRLFIPLYTELAGDEWRVAGHWADDRDTADPAAEQLVWLRSDQWNEMQLIAPESL